MALTRKRQHPYSEKRTKSKPSFPEVPFSVSLGENLVEEKIDLLFEAGRKWVIVDYKTDDPTRNGAPGMPALSIEQLAEK